MTLSNSVTGALKISLLILSEFNQINLTKTNFFWKLCESTFTEKGFYYKQKRTLKTKTSNIKLNIYCKYFK